VVLVTHDMSAVEHYCHRAMLLHDGSLLAEGDPKEVARRYLRLNFEGPPTRGAGGDWGEPADVRLVEAWIEGPDGTSVEGVESGTPLRLNAVFEAARDVEGPSFGFVFTNADGVEVAGFGNHLPSTGPDRLKAGQRVRISGTIENPLAPGRYVVTSWVYREHSYGKLVLHAPQAIDFVVFGSAAVGVVSLDHEVEVEIEAGP
jgi:hypothetical protein